jgi:cation-transporting ATPase E
MAEGLFNESAEQPSKTVRQIVRDNVFTYFNLIFLIIAILLIIAGSFRDLTFLPVIISNTVIGIVQEINAKKTLDKLTILHAPKGIVVREGKSRLIPSEQMVLDDIVIFRAGQQICADARVIHGEIRVNESLLTGESDELLKSADDILMSGSFVTSGQCLAQLTAVGKDSYIYKLTAEARTAGGGEQSEMIRSLNNLLRFIGIIIIPVGIILFIQSYSGGATFRASITSMVAAIIGMIPEGLYLLTSVALAVSTVRLGQKKVLVHDMKCIETLARVDTLCVDKTGTVTENKMSVQEYVPLVEGLDAEALIARIVQVFPKDNDTLTALQDRFVADEMIPADSVVPFSSATKYSAASIGGLWYVYGAPEFVLREQMAAYQEQVEGFARQGRRVIVFAVSDAPVSAGKPLTGSVRPFALVTLANSIRANAPETFAYFRRQGVSIKVISGDNPVTVSAVAAEAGIPHAERYVDASTLKSYTDIRSAVEKYTVFGRVVPSQKRDMVRALKELGKTVAMTGDGVNDVLALKEADCSVAMASGSDAAAHVSQLVLLESDFSRMPDVVAEGRRVINNIERSASLFLVKNIFSLLMSVFTVFALYNYPLQPSQISLISMFTIGVPAFFLSLEPNHNRVSGHFTANVLMKALPAGLTDFFVVGAMVIFADTFGVDAADASTAATLLMSTVGIMILYRIMKPMNRYHTVLLAAMIGGLLFCLKMMKGLFAITSISPKCAMLLVVFAIITEPSLRYLGILVEKGHALFLMARKEMNRTIHHIKGM